MSGPALLDRIDQAIGELAELRAELVASCRRHLATAWMPPRLTTWRPTACSTPSASARFGYPQDTIRKWCRTEDSASMPAAGGW